MGEARDRDRREGRSIEKLPLPIITDVEEAFGDICLEDNQVIRDILKVVEGGQFNDSLSCRVYQRCLCPIHFFSLLHSPYS